MQKLSRTTIGIVLGWGILVVVAVQGLEAGVGIWKRRSEELDQAREQWSRLQGWLQAEDEISTERNKLLGAYAHRSEKEMGWAVLQDFQQMVQQQGLVVRELRPSQLLGLAHEPKRFRMDANLEGPIEQMNGFFQRLPDAIPGIRLESLQLVPQSNQRLQLLLRLDLPAWEVS